MFDNNNLPINNNSGVCNPDVCTHGISPHYIIQYRNHMSNICINMVNSNKNSLSTLDIQYIGYFYYVFPLHLNSFNRLFLDVINPKLDPLKLYIFQLLHPYLYSIKKTKSKLDNLSYTIILLDDLNNHLNIYKKPDIDNLKTIIDFFVKILISGIDSDSSKITLLKQFIETVKPKLSTLKSYFENIIREFNKSKSFKITATESYRIFFLARYRLLSKKLNEFSSKITPLCQTLEETIRYLSDTGGIDSNDPKNEKEKLENNQNYLDSTFKSILEELKIFPSLENIQYIQNVQSKLQLVESQITTLKSEVSTQKDILDNFYNYYVEDMVPLKTEDHEVASYSANEGNREPIKSANQKTLRELQQKCKSDLHSLRQFITNYTTNIKEFDTKLKQPCSCIDETIKKVDETKSQINKRNLVEYIIKLIDTVKVIISIEPSQIVDHLKPIYSIKPELESIVNSFRVTDIQTDINKLQSLYEEIVKIESFSTNMTKLKGYIASVEIHLAGIDYISKSFTNIERILSNINRTLIFTHLQILMEDIYNHKSNLNEHDPVKKYMDQIKHYISTLNYLVSMINQNINKIEPLIYELNKAVDYTKTKMNFLTSDITNMECAIEGVTRNFIKCTLLSHGKYVIDKGSGIGVAELDKKVVSMYSVSNVMDYKVVVNRMLEFWTFCDESVELFKYIRFCLCSLSFETKHKGDRPSTFPHSLPCIKTCDVNPVSEFGRQTMSDNLGNHLCLCLLIKYHMRPTLLKCILYLRNEELGSLDTISRKYERYNRFGYESLRWKMCGLLVTVIYEFTSFIRNNYPYARIRYKNKDDIKCLCSFYDEKNYNYFVSIILVLSSILENIFTMDTQSVRVTFECLSYLIRDFDMIDSDNNSKKSNNLEVKISSLYNALTIKQTQLQNKSSGMFYSKSIRIKSKNLRINDIINYFLSFISLIRKLNITMDSTNRLYQIFTRVSFEIVNKVDNKTTITITRSIGMNLSNVYLKILKKICGNDKYKKKEQCKCGLSIIYGLLILTSYNELTSNMDIINEALKTVVLTEKIQSGELVKIINIISSSPINKIQLLKNNLLTSSSYHILNSKNTIESRNWGQDTYYEHDLATLSNTNIISLFSIFIGLLAIT